MYIYIYTVYCIIFFIGKPIVSAQLDYSWKAKVMWPGSDLSGSSREVLSLPSCRFHPILLMGP